jgi:hypothetical protein
MKWSEAYEKAWSISVPVKLIHALGAKGAILVSQLYWWKGKERDPDGWIYKTKRDLTKETGLTHKEQRKCVEELKNFKILETHYDRVDHRLRYRLCIPALDDIMARDLPEELPEEEDSPAEVPKGHMPKEHLRKQHMPKRQVAQDEKAGGTGPKGTSLYSQEITQEETQEITKTKTPAREQRSQSKRKIRRGSPESSSSFSLAVDRGGEKAINESVQRTIQPAPELFALVPEDQPVTIPLISIGIDPLLAEFGPFNSKQRKNLANAYERDPDYVMCKAEIVRSEPRKNLARALIAALRDNWQPAQSTLTTKSDIGHGWVASPPETQKPPDEASRARVAGLCADLLADLKGR